MKDLLRAIAREWPLREHENTSEMERIPKSNSRSRL
jgi:hypothetical protein